MIPKAVSNAMGRPVSLVTWVDILLYSRANFSRDAGIWYWFMTYLFGVYIPAADLS